MTNYSKEQIWWPLYDFQRIERLRDRHDFFLRPMGGTDLELKTEADTNLYLPGQLPASNAFLMSGIRVVFIPDAYSHRGRIRQDLQDIKRVLLAGVLRFQIANRLYTQLAPLARAPACFPLYHEFNESTFKRWIKKISLFRVQKHAYFEVVPIYIEGQQFFHVEIVFNEREQVKLNAPGRLGVILDGRLIRT